MNYCKPIDANTAEHYNLRQLKSDYPDVGWPQSLFDGSLDVAIVNERAAEYGIYPYTIPAQPAFDAAIEKIEEGGILNNAGTWAKQWIVTPLSQEELDALAAQAVTESVRADNALKNFVDLGPSGIALHIDNNVADPATANVLKKLAKIVWLGMKDQFSA